MKKLLLIPLALIITSCQAKNDFIIGTWQSECFSSTLTNNILETSIYNKDYTFSVRRMYLLGGGVNYSGTYKIKRIEDFPAKPELGQVRQYEISHKIKELKGGDMPKELIKKITALEPNSLWIKTEKYTCNVDKV